MMSYNINTGMYEGYIYKIDNDINEKLYIGYTKNTVEERFEQHMSKVRCKGDNSIIHLAIDKYGYEHFHIHIIEKITDDTEDGLLCKLKNAERSNISLFNTITPHGYNILAGGESVPINRRHPIYQLTMCGELITQYKSATDAIQLNGFKDTSKNSKILACLKTNHCAFGYLWSDNLSVDVVLEYFQYNKNKQEREQHKKENKQRIVKRKSNKTSSEYSRKGGRCIYCYDLVGNLIHTYKSIMQAHREIGIQHDKIYYSAKSHKILCDMYIFSFDLLLKKDFQLPVNKCKKKVCQYDLFNNLIGVFDSLTSAALFLGDIKKVSAISQCCCGDIYTAYGYIWKYVIDC